VCFGKLTKFLTIKDKYSELEDKLSVFRRKLEADKLLSETRLFCDKMHDMTRKLESLHKYVSLKNELDILQTDRYFPLQHLYEKVLSLDIGESLRKLELLRATKQRYDKLCVILNTALEKHEGLKSKYVSMMEQEQICPTCFSNVDEGVIKQIEENL